MRPDERKDMARDVRRKKFNNMLASADAIRGTLSLDELRQRIKSSKNRADLNLLRFEVVRYMKTDHAILKEWQDKYFRRVK